MLIIVIAIRYHIKNKSGSLAIMRNMEYYMLYSNILRSDDHAFKKKHHNLAGYEYPHHACNYRRCDFLLLRK